MAGPLFSNLWYRVADLRPRLRAHSEIRRHIFRGAVWYVLEDHASGKYQRLSQAGYQLVGLMNGHRTIDEIWRTAGERLGDALPTQDETIQLLVKLHKADLLHADIPPDMARVTERGADQSRRTALRSFRNPLSVRVPLIDPDRFLELTSWAVRPLLGKLGIVFWLAAVGTGVLLAAQHWASLTGNVTDRVLTAGNLVLLVAIYPAVKAIHELGHAYTAKRLGGEVHDIGIMFLVFMPVPYVEASASSGFRSKWHRAAVAAAGIMVELFLAALAMMLWTQLEPGLLRAAMFNVMLLTGVSTLLFNGNPLLRFDGYYVLSDLVEIPNLGSRANQYLLHLVQRHLFGLTDARSPALAAGEARWFVAYGIAALLYRLFIMSAIILFVAQQFFEVGVFLALWAVTLMLLVPLAKGLWFVLASPRLDDRRPRALAVTGGGAAGLLWLLAVQPVPHATLVEGVVWVPERMVVRAGANGFVTERFAEAGARVEAGTPLLQIDDPLRKARAELLDARVEELQRERVSMLVEDRVAVQLVSRELALARDERALARERRGEQRIESPTAGRLAVPEAGDVRGRFVRKGEVLAYVVDPEGVFIRTAVPQGRVDPVRNDREGVSVRLASRPQTAQPARVIREVPAATDKLPSRALASAGGGTIAVGPGPDGRGRRSLESLFLFDVETAEPMPFHGVGERVYLKIDHGAEPVAYRLGRALRRVFLSRLDV